LSHQNGRHYLPNTLIEIIRPCFPCRPLRHVLFDFDGTISLIREGWQQIMISMMVEFLLATPKAEDETTISQTVTDLVYHSTGRPTIDQMTYLATEVVRRGGPVREPQMYKSLYLDQLLARVHQRMAGLKGGRIEPVELAVPGVLDLLDLLHQQGVTCHLASGTEKEAVIEEIEALGASRYFGHRIYGPQDGGPAFSKKTVIHQILSDYHLASCELISIGDGKVEIEYMVEAGGIGIGVASNEVERRGVNEIKRRQLIQAGASVIIPDFCESAALLRYLHGEKAITR
jgi:phosphoglycolate phosphatase-like HAD superfamily hydrolase